MLALNSGHTIGDVATPDLTGLVYIKLAWQVIQDYSAVPPWLSYKRECHRRFKTDALSWQTGCLCNSLAGFQWPFRRWILTKGTGELTFVRWLRPVAVKTFLILLRFPGPVRVPICGSFSRKPFRPGQRGL
jgi:hypothetical protein